MTPENNDNEIDRMQENFNESSADEATDTEDYQVEPQDDDE